MKSTKKKSSGSILILCIALLPLLSGAMSSITLAAGSTVPVYELALPESLVGMSVQLNNWDACTTNVATKYTNSMYMTLFNVPEGFDVTNRLYGAECVDPSGTVSDYRWGTRYNVLLYSSTDPGIPLHLQGVSWNVINFILNIEQLSELRPTWLDKQAAIWSLLDTSCGTDPLTGLFTCQDGSMPFTAGPTGAGCPNKVDQNSVYAILMAANSHGVQFIPGPGQKVAVIVEPIECYGNLTKCAQNPDMQTSIIELVVPDCTNSIGDYIWHDKNHNGIQDAGEPGLNGVIVNLKDSSGKIVATATTGHGPLNQDGYYQFTGLCGTEYSVEVETPPGFSPTTPNAGGDPTEDSNGSPAQVFLAAAANSSDLTIDFGFTSPFTGKIGDFVWHDLNHNGIQDAGEPGIEEITVVLKDATGSELQTATTGVGPNGQLGYYQFTGLGAGEYTVEVAIPSGYTLAEPFGIDTTVDSNPNPATVALQWDDSVDPTIDFGLQTPWTGKIGDFVWIDLNHDGVQDGGEPGLEGVTVKLTDAMGTVSTTTTGIGPNDQTGYYQFTGLGAGTYSVEIVVPANYTLATSPAGTDSAKDSNGNPSTVTLSWYDSVDETIDFGLQRPWTGRIGNFVWHDLNHDGLQDAGEPGLDGITVNLRDVDTNAVIATTTTGAGETSPHGYYQFRELHAGTYKVEVVTPEGYDPTIVLPGSDDDTIDSNGSPTYVTLLEDSSVDQTVDFGFKTPWTGRIGNFVWHDQNHNGLQDPEEPGINGVRVNLKDAQGTIIKTTTTGPDPSNDQQQGYYEFTGLGAGDYRVEVVKPCRFTPTDSFQGTDPALDSNASPASVTLSWYESVDETVDFGFETPCFGKIGNYVWNDLNHNGIQDFCRTKHFHHKGCQVGKEPGLDGVKVNLKNAETGEVIATTTTGSDFCNQHGYYQFTGLCAGTYIVEVATPKGFTPTLRVVGTDRSIDSNGSPATVTLTQDNGSNLTVDFGFYKVCPPGTGTPGYWKNHPKAWPVDSILIGGITYSKEDALAIMSKSTCGDSTHIMFRALVAAKLNVLVGNDDSCIANTIAAADAWMTTYPPGSNVSSWTQAWKEGNWLAATLDYYNNGWLCAPSRDRQRCGDRW